MTRLDDETENLISLAWHQGILRQPSLNAFQLFAARYQIKRQREQFVADADNMLEKGLYYLNQPRHQELFPELYESTHEPLTFAGRPVEEVVRDVDEYDRYFAELENKRVMTGGEALAFSDDEGWV
jgi:ribonucleotide reductase alpha subunit